LNDKLLLKDKQKTILTYLCSFFLPALIMMFAFLTVGVFWGGPKSTLLVDGKLQYVAFFSEYARQLKNFAPPFFSRYMGPGQAFFGTWAYYLSSPINLLLVLFPESRVLDAIYLITLVKIGLCGLSFNVFVQRGLKIQNLSSILFSTAYALCSTVIYNADNLQWLDGIIWLPIIVLGIERIYERGRCAYLPFVLTILIISNFYSAALCAPFCVLYVIYVMVRSSRDGFIGKRGAFFGKVLVSALFGVGMAAVVLLPVYSSLQSDMNLIGQDFPKLELSANPLISMAEMTLARNGAISQLGQPKIYSSLLCLVLIPLFARAKRISRRYKWISFGFLFLLFTVFHVSSLNFLFHCMDFVLWYPFRYAFVFSFFLIKMGAEGYRDGNSHYVKNKKICVMVYLVFFIFYLLPISILGYPDELRISLVIILLNMIFFALYMVIPEMKRGSTILLLAVLAMELFLNSAYINRNIDEFARYTQYEGWTHRREQIEQIVSENRGDGDVNRIAIRTNTLTANDPALLGIEGIDYFSSMGKSEMTHTLRRMGYIMYVSYICDISDNGGNYIADALLGIEGQVFEESAIRIMSIPPSVFPLRHQGDQSIHNPLVYKKTPVHLSGAFGVKESVLSFSEDAYGNDPIAYNDALLSAMTGKDVSTCQPIPNLLTVVNANKIMLEKGVIAYSQVNQEKPGHVKVRLTGEGEGFPLFVDLKLLFNFDGAYGVCHIYLEEEGKRQLIRGIDMTPVFTHLCIGEFSENATVDIDIEFHGTIFFNDPLDTYSQSIDEVQKSIEPLLQNQAEFEWTGSSSARILTQNDSGDILFVSLPFDTGWTATMDGEAAEVLDVAGGFIGLRMPEGAHEYRLSFIPNGLKEGFGIAVVSFVFALAWVFVLYRKRSAVSEKKMHE